MFFPKQYKRKRGRTTTTAALVAEMWPFTDDELAVAAAVLPTAPSSAAAVLPTAPSPEAKISSQSPVRVEVPFSRNTHSNYTSNWPAAKDVVGAEVWSSFYQYVHASTDELRGEWLLKVQDARRRAGLPSLKDADVCTLLCQLGCTFAFQLSVHILVHILVHIIVHILVHTVLFHVLVMCTSFPLWL